MSILGKKWIIKNTDNRLNTFEKVRENRGFSTSEHEEKFHSSFLFTNMEKATERIKKAIDSHERIIVFGDYDVDGITGTAIVVHVLQKLNANVSYRIPHRLEDGYGLSEKFIDSFIEKQVGLIITVDCGISCFKEIAKANAHKIDTIITDHHTIPKNIPEAFAIIHPKIDQNYPYQELTGAGVAFKLAQALAEKFLPDEQNEIINSLTDLASLGTVADLGPLTGENRYLVKQGLQTLSATKWLGLKKIMELASIKNEINTVTIGYHIAPRINAAGRIGNPYIPLTLLLEQTENEKISVLGLQLEELNEQRKKMTQTALEEAESLFQNSQLPAILIAENPNWHVGVLGLVAGKLAEKYNRPAIIMQDLDDVFVASARSPQAYNLIEGITACSTFLENFGGHAQAAGFSLKKDNLPDFKIALTNFFNEKSQNIDPTPLLEIDCEIATTEINKPFFSNIETLKPFGIGNTTPLFLVNSIEPLFISQVGSENQHLKFHIKTADEDVKVMAFNLGRFADDLRKHRKIDLVCSLEKNIWNNKETLELRALDFRASEL